MMILFYLLLFILGAAVGSFLGVVVDRIAGRESVWKGRSHCDHCRHHLGVFDLIPIVSFFLLGRKCRYCHKKLSWFYPLIEFCTGLVFVIISYVVVGTSLLLFAQIPYLLLVLYYVVMSSSLIVIFFTDLRYGIIPFKAVAVAFAVTILWYFILFVLPITSAYMMEIIGIDLNLVSILFSAIGAGGFFFLLFAITRGRGMGFGDVIYAFLMGFTLGFPRVLLGLYIAFVTGALVALLLVVLKKKKLKGGTIPFGPLLVGGE